MTVPVRYHGSAQPYAVYYTHGTSAPATNTTYVYHGASGGNASGTLHLPPRPYDPADDSMYGPAANRYSQQRPIGVAHFQNRPGVRGMFTESGGSPESSRSFPSRDTLAARPQKNSNSGAAGIRRASLSPVLTALKPGNYHIANLPDHDLGDSSDSSDSSTDSQLQKRMQMMPVNNTRPAQQQQQQQQQQQLQKMQPEEDVHANSNLPGLPAAINTSLLRNDLRQGIGQCDTGDSTITPLSVVNVMPVLYTLGPGYSAHAGDDGQIDGNRTMTELPSEPQDGQSIGLKAFDDGLPSRIDELPAASLREAADAMELLDAESIASSDQEEPRPDGLDEHFDLVENAADLDTESTNGDSCNVFAVFDAEEIDDSTSGPSDPSSTGTGSMPLVLDAEEIDEPDDRQQEACGAMAVFDADEIDEDNDDGGLSSRSSVVIDAYETESIFSSGDHHHDTDAHQMLPVSAPVLPPPIITALTDRHNDRQNELDDSAEKPMAGQQQQSKSADASEAFRVKGVRHVVTFGTDFDKTAATLLSSIKDDIARKAAAGIIVSPGSASNKPLPTAASIAAAIEHHQQKQKNKKKSSKPADESPAATADSQTPTNKHTSRFSGLFGFGPRAQKSPAASAAASPSGGGGISGSLRVVTDFQSLRNNASSGSLTNNNNNNNNEAPSSDGKKSASPSTVSKRWRVPFRQLKSSNASTTAEPASLQSAKPGDEASDPAVVTGTTRVMRRSRYRAGTTSDIESPQTAAKVLGTVGERPYSMVENTTSSSSGAVTPTRRLFRQQQQQQQQQHSPGVPNVAVRGSRVFQHDSLSPVHTRVRFQKGGGSTSGSESEIISPAAAMSLGRRPIQAVVGLNNGSSSLNSPATESESGSFFTAGSATPADAKPKPLDKADSWTLMFFNKEFVVQPTQATGTAASTVPTDETLLDPRPPPPPPDTETAMEPPPPPPSSSANEVFIDSDNDEAGQEKTQQEPESYDDDDDDDDDAGSVASSTRALPSTMRFTKGMRATLLERRPSQNIRGRPTADIIGEQLDEYFPDHDLDKPIVQSMVLSDGTGVLAPDRKYHIIVSEEESNGTQSVRMLVQETRQKRRRQFRARTPAIGSPDALDRDRDRGRDQDPLPSLPSAGSRELPLDSVAATPSPSSLLSSPGVLVPDAPQPPPILRRKSTKLWGCIPEEIRPSGRRNGGNSNDIVRRALSLLRKPEPDPQAEKDIVEAAIKCNDISSVGSTRAHFVTQRARQQQREKLADGVVSTDVLAEIQLRAITIQWIKGKLIGKGSFGNVHVAINAATGEVIAVKQIRLPKSICALTTKDKGSQKAKSQWEEAVGMMYTEVELLKDLDHENIVQLLGFEIAGGVMSMFLEYVPGGTVQSLVQQHGPLPESVVHSFLRQILAGLAYLHERGILHRDIKGANILVDETGTCKISDFGISRRTDHSSLVALLRGSSMSSSQGKIIGTVPFMAPEVARGARYTEAADIWSLGCVVVQMWSGRPPWDELQEPQVFFKLGRGKAPPVPDDLTEDGLDFCKKCFAAVPEQRLAAGQLACMDFARVPNDYEYPYHANL
ncbi:mitogen-activated protein kinase kinase kinase [Coemansia sp. RSA 1286]|nr:mitogen-activated protein kinase kinase kinase [Coemansia sp. RSA 1286]